MTALLDKSPLGVMVRIARIDWTAMSDDEGRRLREFGLMVGCGVTPNHRGSIFSRDPLALTVRSMKVIIRARQAAAIEVEPAACRRPFPPSRSSAIPMPASRARQTHCLARGQSTPTIQVYPSSPRQAK